MNLQLSILSSSLLESMHQTAKIQNTTVKGTFI